MYKPDEPWEQETPLFYMCCFAQSRFLNRNTENTGKLNKLLKNYMKAASRFTIQNPVPACVLLYKRVGAAAPWCVNVKMRRGSGVLLLRMALALWDVPVWNMPEGGGEDRCSASYHHGHEFNALYNLFCVFNTSELFLWEQSSDRNTAEFFRVCPTWQIPVVNLLTSVLW